MPVRISVKKELFRKSIHLCSGFVPLVLYYFYWPTIVLLVLAVTAYSTCEFLRLKGYEIPVVSLITETAARKRDEDKFVLGPVTLVCGILLAALFLPFESAMVGIFALSFGDGCASLIGKIFGRVKIPHMGGKTLEGCLACCTAVFLSTLAVSKDPLLSLGIGCITMLIEVLPLFDFDNLIIPLTIGSFYFFFTTGNIPFI